MLQRAILALLGLGAALAAGFPTEEPQNGKNWVVIVAGSNGWYNYRHQVRGGGPRGPWKPREHAPHSYICTFTNIISIFVLISPDKQLHPPADYMFPSAFPDSKML